MKHSYFTALILIGVILALIVAVAWFLAELILVVVAANQANQGEAFRYPFTIRFLQ